MYNDIYNNDKLEKYENIKIKLTIHMVILIIVTIIIMTKAITLMKTVRNCKKKNVYKNKRMTMKIL